MPDTTDDAANDDPPVEDGATLQLPPRTNRPPPEPEPQPGDYSLEALLCGAASLVLGYLAYLWLASRHLGLFMFDVGRVDALLGTWSGVVGFLYAAVCCMVAMDAFRRLAARRVRPGVAMPSAVLIGLSLSVVATMMLVAFATAALMALGIFGLFFHSGDR